MENLININQDNSGNQVVSARELHTFLEVQTDFTDWCKRMFEYGFTENQDYIILLKFEEKPISKSNPIDYALTLDTAKEISMLQRSEKGKQARRYFIECEKKLKEAIPKLSRKEMALMVIEQEEKLERLQLENDKLKPRSEFIDKVFVTNDLITMSQTAKILKLPYGRNTLLKNLRHKGILFKNSNEPYQHYVDKGYFVVKEKIQERDNKPPIIFMQTFPTQKGLAFIAKVLGVVEIKDQRMKLV